MLATACDPEREEERNKSPEKEKFIDEGEEPRIGTEQQKPVSA